MDPIWVNGHKIKTNKHGQPRADDLSKRLFPMDPDLKRRAESCAYDTYIDNLSDFLNRVAKRTATTKKTLYSFIKFDAPQNEKKKTTRKRIIEKEEWDEDDVDVYVENEEGLFSSDSSPREVKRNLASQFITPSPAPAPQGQRGQREEEEDDVWNLFSSSSSPRSESDDDEDDLIPPPPLVQRLSVASADQRRDMILANAQVVQAYASMLATTNPGDRGDAAFRDEIKNAAMPFIDALKGIGPLRSAGMDFMAPSRPEKTGDRLFGTSERARELGVDPASISVSDVGKRALELYKQRYPHHVPPQRSARNRQGHEFMMNLYTDTTTVFTLDKAILEARTKKRRKQTK